MGPGSRVLLFIGAILTLVIVPVAAGAQGDSDPEPVPAGSETQLLMEDASFALILSIASLTELEGFETNDREANEVLQDIRRLAQIPGLKREDYVMELRFFAEDWEFILEDLTREGIEPGGVLRAIASEINSPEYEAVLAGDRELLDPLPWLDGLVDLLSRDDVGVMGPETDDPASLVRTYLATFDLIDKEADNQGPPETLASQNPVPVDPGDTNPVTVDSEDTDPASSSGLRATDDESEQSLVLPLSIVAVVGLVLTGFWFGKVRTSSSRSTSGRGSSTSELASFDELLDASRRMTSSLDSAEIAQIALAEARRLVEADAGLFVLRGRNELIVAGADPEGFFRPEAVNQSSLSRAVQTGQALATISANDPMITGLTLATASVPIIADGTIIGALMVARTAAAPFERVDIEALEKLVPLAGSAVQAASTHGSATRLVDIEPLTGLKNRRRLDRDLSDFARESTLSYLMIDIDHFKVFNDQNGHTAGDEALRLVARILSETVRPEDGVYRYGGEEFCVILPGATVEEAMVIAERAREAIASAEIPGASEQPGGHLTVSVGVADTTAGKISSIIDRADSALYQAKHDGRNLVRCES